LLDVAKKDLAVVDRLIEVIDSTGDKDLYSGNVCYHIQQCIEKCLKYLIQVHGKQFSYTHNIVELLNSTKDVLGSDGIDAELLKFFKETLENRANTYSFWESTSRYTEGFRETVDNLKEGQRVCHELYSICLRYNAMSLF
jgi:HEPN domain-containing protein